MKINWFKIHKVTLTNILSVLILTGSKDTLYLINYLKQGKICKDCEEEYLYCFCNVDCGNCNYLGYTICTCKYKLINEIRRFGIEFIKEILSKNNIKFLIKRIKIDRKSYHSSLNNYIEGYEEYLEEICELIGLK